MKLAPLLALAALCALALGACGNGGSDNASASSDNDRDTAQLRLQDCLRKQGITPPQRPQSGSSGSTSFRRPSQAERQKMQRAIQGPCKAEAKKAFGNITSQDRQEMRDRMVKFSSCMRQHGVNLPDITPGGGPQQVRINPDNPKFKAASEACRKLLPRPPGGGSRQGGPGGGGFFVGPPPGGSQ